MLLQPHLGRPLGIGCPRWTLKMEFNKEKRGRMISNYRLKSWNKLKFAFVCVKKEFKKCTSSHLTSPGFPRLPVLSIILFDFSKSSRELCLQPSCVFLHTSLHCFWAQEEIFPWKIFSYLYIHVITAARVSPPWTLETTAIGSAQLQLTVVSVVRFQIS